MRAARRRVEEDDHLAFEPDRSVAREPRDLRGHRFPRAADERGDFRPGQAHVEERSAFNGFPVFDCQPLEQSQQTIGDPQVGDVLAHRERLVETFAQILCDVEREHRVAGEQAEEIVRACETQERVVQANGDRRAPDLGEDDFLAEEISLTQEGDRGLLPARSHACDSNAAALDQIDDMRRIALLEEDGAFLVHLLDEDVLALFDEILARAFEEARPLEQDDFILCGGHGRHPVKET